MTPGVAVGDFDRDGYLDLVVQGGLWQNAALFMNTGDGTFVNEALLWGIDVTVTEGSSVSVADVDGNGYPDLYLGAHYGRNYLYLNSGERTFVEAAVFAGVAMEPPVGEETFGNIFGAAFGDIDLDGDLDLYTTQWGTFTVHGNRLFENRGLGKFVDITERAGLVQAPGEYWAFSPALVDMDGDRYPELLVAADFETSRYFVNNGDGTFTRLLGTGTCTDENGMGSALGDYDNDGDLDWFVTSIFDDDGVGEGWGITGNRLYRNEGGNLFTDVTDLADVRNGDWGWGTSFADLNNDGLLDLLMTNGYLLPDLTNTDPTFINDPSRVWINLGNFDSGPTFIEVAALVGVTHDASGKGLVTFDAENDGDLDIVITTNRGDLAFYRNESTDLDHNWLEIDLVPPLGNAPDGFGSVVYLTVGGVTYRRVVHGGNPYMGHEAPRLHFGFPASKQVDEIRIHWPDGSRKRLTSVRSGRLIVVKGRTLGPALTPTGPPRSP